MRNGGFKELKRLLKQYSHVHKNISGSNETYGYIEPDELHNVINRSCGPISKIGTTALFLQLNLLLIRC